MGVASIGDKTGVTTGALNFGANVSHKSCSQTRIDGDIRGHSWYSGGGVWHYGGGRSRWRRHRGARGDVKWEKCPRVNKVVGVGALPTLDTGGVLDLDCLVLTMTGAPMNSWSSPWIVTAA